MEEHTLSKKVIRDGVCIAVMETLLPRISEGSKADGFYAALAAGLSEWFERSASNRAKADYDASDDERKRWRWAPLTVFAGYIVKETGEGKLAVTHIVSVTDASGKRAIKRRTIVWSRNGERVFSIRSEGPRKYKAK